MVHVAIVKFLSDNKDHFFLILLISFLPAALSASESHLVIDSSKTQSHYEFRSITSFSYTGFQQSINFDFAFSHHHFYIGPSLSISDAYMPWHSDYGFQVGYQFMFPVKAPFVTVAGTHFQTLFGTTGTENKNITGQGFLTYGAGLTWNKICIINTVGFGRYYERYHHPSRGEAFQSGGYDFIITINVLYRFRN